MVGRLAARQNKPLDLTVAERIAQIPATACGISDTARRQPFDTVSGSALRLLGNRPQDHGQPLTTQGNVGRRGSRVENARNLRQVQYCRIDLNQRFTVESVA